MRTKIDHVAADAVRKIDQSDAVPVFADEYSRRQPLASESTTGDRGADRLERFLILLHLILQYHSRRSAAGLQIY
jgi:hypothetical protein